MEASCGEAFHGADVSISGPSKCASHKHRTAIDLQREPDNFRKTILGRFVANFYNGISPVLRADECHGLSDVPLCFK